MRHVSRRLVAGVAVAVSAGMLVTACSSSGGGSTSSTDLKGQTISYWLWDTNQQPAYEACASNFTAKTGIKVKVSQYGWADYWKGISTGFAAGTAPDTFADAVAFYPDFVKQGQILDLTSYIKRDKVDMSQYQPGLANLWNTDGKQYGLPKDFDTVGLFYNEKMVQQAGLTADDMSKLTWNPTDGGTYEQLLAKLTVDKNGKHGDQAGFDKNNIAVYGLGLSVNGIGASEPQGWSPYALSNNWTFGNKTPGTTKYNYTSEKFLETMQWWRSLIQKGYMQPLKAAISEADPSSAYLAGKIAMVTDGDWMNTTYLGQSKVATNVAPTPIGPSGKRASVYNGLTDAIWSGTKHKEAAWQWVKYLGSTACQDVVAAHAVVFPAIKTATTKAEAQFKAKGWNISALTVQIDDKTTYLNPIGEHYADVDSTMKAAEEAYLQGGSLSALKSAGNQVNALFK